MPITFTLATDGQPAQQLTLPANWAEVTLAQYLAAHDGSSPHAPALRLSGLPSAVLDTLPTDAAELLAYHLAFANDPSALEAWQPTPGLYEIGLSMYGLQKQALKHLATLPENAHPLVFGAYLHALYTDRVGSTAPAEQMAAAHTAVLARPLPEVYADCQYYLASWRRVGTGAPAVGVAQPGVQRITRTLAPAPARNAGLLTKLGHKLRRMPTARG